MCLSIWWSPLFAVNSILYGPRISQRQYYAQCWSHLHVNRKNPFAIETVCNIVVYLLVILAAVIPNLGAIISLVGAVSSSALALIAPPIIEIITFHHVGYGPYNWMFWKDIFILIFGLCGFVFGTWASLAQILKPSVG